MRGTPMALLLGLSLASAVLAGSYWESRGDTYMKSGRYQEAAEAYETALGSDTGNRALLLKYETAFLKAYMGKVQQTVKERGTRGLSRPARMLRPPTPTPRSTPESVASSAPSTATTGEAAPGGERAEGKQGVRVREDGVVEVDFGSLLDRGLRGGVSRVAGGGRSETRGARAAEPEEDDEEPEEPEPEIYGAAETVRLGTIRQGFEGSRGEDVEPENVTVRSAKYDITGIKVYYDKRGDLHISGDIKNITSDTVRNPRVYVRIYDEAGVLRGRTFAYVEPGRNTLPPRRTKSFDVHFRGYREPVASYKFEVIP